MAILKLAPALKDYLWSGQRLREEFGIVINGKIPQIATAKLGKEAGIIGAANYNRFIF